MTLRWFPYSRSRDLGQILFVHCNRLYTVPAQFLTYTSISHTPKISPWASMTYVRRVHLEGGVHGARIDSTSSWKDFFVPAAGPSCATVSNEQVVMVQTGDRRDVCQFHSTHHQPSNQGY